MSLDCDETDQIDDQPPVDEKMLKKKEAFMLMSLKRRAELQAKRAILDEQQAHEREQAALKKEYQESKKLEQKQKREAILERYKQNKKAAQAAADAPRNGDDRISQSSQLHSSNVNSTGISSNSHPATNKSVQSNNHTRPSNKSTSNHHVSVWSLYTRPKLFAKPTVKSNLVIIQNAILKALEGAANSENLRKMQNTIATHSQTCTHFLILFRNRHQFRGLYSYDEKQHAINKLDGIGPKYISNDDIVKYYKFDSPKRQFMEVQTRQISLTIIAFTIHDHLWSKSLSNRVSSQESISK